MKIYGSFNPGNIVNVTFNSPQGRVTITAEYLDCTYNPFRRVTEYLFNTRWSLERYGEPLLGLTTDTIVELRHAPKARIVEWRLTK